MKDFIKNHSLVFIIILIVVIASIASVLLLGKILKIKDNGVVLVNGNSMAPYYNNGDKLNFKRNAEVNRYDVVVLKVGGDTIIKRVYGLPGEKVSINNGMIMINDKVIDDKYGSKDWDNSYDSVTLLDDEYFVLGDNRNNSMDSRIFGPVKKDDIKGVIVD